MKNAEEKTRISVEEYRNTVLQNKPHILIDVRTEPEMEICSLSDSINIPLEEIESEASLKKIIKAISKINNATDSLKSNKTLNFRHIVVVCRRGNDSQVASKILKQRLNDATKPHMVPNQNSDEKYVVQDIIGGLHSWAKRIDSYFPIY